MSLVSGRDYQEEFARRTLPRLWRAGKRAVLGVAPVGAGKTRMAAMVAEDRLARPLADFVHLAHRRELVEQPHALMLSFGIPATRVMAGERPDPTSPCHVASVDTWWNHPIPKTRPMVVVSVDEAHRVVGPRYMETLRRFDAAYGRENVRIVLWTATPYRLDGRPLGDVADALAEVTTPPELFDRGLLMEPVPMGIESPDLNGVPRRGGDWIREAVAERVDSPALVGNVIDTWIRVSGGAPSVYFAVDRAHARSLWQRFLDVGVRARYLDATTPPRERSRMLAGLSIGGRGSGHPEAVDVVVNVDVLREGWDNQSDWELRVLRDESLWLGKSYPPEYVPLEILGDCDPTDSCCAYRQREGRVCRTHPAKRRAILISHSGNWERHGWLRDHHGFALDEGDGDRRTPSQRAISAPGYSPRICRSCLSAWPPGTETCRACGADLSPPPADLPTETDDVLTAIDPASAVRVAPPDPARERRRLRELWATWMRKSAEARSAGKTPAKPGQVDSIFRREFGRWPARDISLAARREAEQASRKKGQPR